MVLAAVMLAASSDDTRGNSRRQLRFAEESYSSRRLDRAAFRASTGSAWVVATNDDFTAWSGPWGVSFAANLTPDRNTGLRSGVWTEDLFIKALRTGTHM